MTKVLIVDDEFFMFNVIEGLFAKVDSEVFYAEDGREALDVIGQTDFDIIFCDGNMPGMDGLEFIKEFRKQNQTTPVIVISNDGSMAKFMLKNGANDTTEKHDIFRYLKKWIASKDL